MQKCGNLSQRDGHRPVRRIVDHLQEPASEISTLADRPSRTLQEFKKGACIGTVESEAPVRVPGRGQ